MLRQHRLAGRASVSAIALLVALMLMAIAAPPAMAQRSPEQEPAER